MKITFISNTSWYLYNFRSSLIKELVKQEYQVNIIAPFDSYTDKLLELGVNYHPIRFTRFKKSIIGDFMLIIKLSNFNALSISLSS